MTRQRVVLLFVALAFMSLLLVATSNFHLSFDDNLPRARKRSSQPSSSGATDVNVAGSDSGQGDEGTATDAVLGEAQATTASGGSDSSAGSGIVSWSATTLVAAVGDDINTPVLNSAAYRLSSTWWKQGPFDQFHGQLLHGASKQLELATHERTQFSKSGGDKQRQQEGDEQRRQQDDNHIAFCSSKVKRRYYYTHRRPRSKELYNLDMYRAAKREAAVLHEIGGPLHRVVNARPVVLNASFDMRHKFGNWHVQFAADPLDAKASPQRVPAEPPMAVALFRHAVVSAGNVVTCAGSVFTAGGCLWEGPGMNSELLQRHNPGEAKGIIAVAMCDGWCRGYYHFSHEHLPRIALVHDLLIHNPHARLVLSNPPVSFAKQFFVDILGIPQDRIIVAGQGGLRAGVVALPTAMRCGNAFTSALVGLRRLVLSKVVGGFHHNAHLHLDEEDRQAGGSGEMVVVTEVAGKSQQQQQQQQHKKKLMILFAERTKLSRMPRNYEELKADIKSKFSAVADFEETAGHEHAREQVMRFHRADIVIGPHGANLANIMFMKPSRHVLEMASYKDGNLCYYSTAMRMNLVHHLVLHDKGKDSHYTLTKKLLRDHVSHAVKQLSSLLGLSTS